MYDWFVNNRPAVDWARLFGLGLGQICHALWLTSTERAGQQLCMHYDGFLSAIASDIAELGFHGIDSFTGPPEGDMTVAQARQAWLDKFLWLHPNLSWYAQPGDAFERQIGRICRDAGERYCLMISEDVPPQWEIMVPRALKVLGNL